MRRKQRTWLRAVGRWAVWGCAGLMLGLMLVSFFVRRGIDFEYQKEDERWGIGPVSIDLGEGRLMVRVWDWQTMNPRYIFHSDRSPALWQQRSGVQVGFTKDPPVNSERWQGWWRVVYAKSPGLVTFVQVPLIYPSLILAGWSFWLIRGRRQLRRRQLRRRVGCCAECGYSLDGLASDVCPECGEKYEA